jgi:hypothetical protein
VSSSHWDSEIDAGCGLRFKSARAHHSPCSEVFVRASRVTARKHEVWISGRSFKKGKFEKILRGNPYFHPLRPVRAADAER